MLFPLLTKHDFDDRCLQKFLLEKMSTHETFYQKITLLKVNCGKIYLIKWTSQEKSFNKIIVWVLIFVKSIIRDHPPFLFLYRIKIVMDKLFRWIEIVTKIFFVGQNCRHQIRFPTIYQSKSSATKFNCGQNIDIRRVRTQTFLSLFGVIQGSSKDFSGRRICHFL